MIKKIICLFKGHRKIMYTDKNGLYIVECTRCKESNKWKMIRKT